MGFGQRGGAGSGSLGIGVDGGVSLPILPSTCTQGCFPMFVLRGERRGDGVGGR